MGGGEFASDCPPPTHTCTGSLPPLSLRAAAAFQTPDPFLLPRSKFPHLAALSLLVSPVVASAPRPSPASDYGVSLWPTHPVLCAASVYWKLSGQAPRLPPLCPPLLPWHSSLPEGPSQCRTPEVLSQSSESSKEPVLLVHLFPAAPMGRQVGEGTGPGGPCFCPESSGALRTGLSACCVPFSLVLWPLH